MKHVATGRRIPVLSTVLDVAGLLICTVWEGLDNVADRLSRSRVFLVVAKVLTVLVVVVVLALVTGCGPKDSQPGPIENTALEARL